MSTPEQKRTLSDEEYVAQKIEQYERYKAILEESYWPNFRINEDLYAGYDPQKPNKFSTNTGTGIVESGVNRTMVSSRKITADIKGPVATINRKIEQALENLADSIFDDKDIAKIKGTYRANKEVLVRDLRMIGNCVGERNYLYKTTEVEGRTRVLADGTYITPLHYSQYVFNPARPYNWCTSPEKFVYKTTSFDALEQEKYEEFTEEEEAEEPVVDEMGQPVIDPMTGEPQVQKVMKKVKKSAGIWKNLDKLKERAEEKGKLKPLADNFATENYTGNNGTVGVWVEDINLLYCWDGPNLCVIAEDSTIIQEEYDPYGTGSDNLLTAMFIQQGTRPVGWGVLDHIRGLIQLKDDSLNDRKAIVDRILKIGGFLNETDPNKVRQAAQMILRGGIVPGDGSKWTPANVINPSVAQALLTPSEIQSEIERTALYSPFASGQLSQETDKTAGTARGINSIQQAAEPNFETFLEKVQEQLDTPFLDWSMQVLANVSGDDDIRWVTRTRGSREVIGLTKRFLQGSPTLDDLIMAGVITEEEAAQYVDENPQLAEEPYVDANWTIGVKLDPQSASDKYQRAMSEKALVDEAIDRGVPIEPQKAYTRIAEKMGFEDFNEYILSPEEIIQRQKKAQQEAALQEQKANQAADMEHQRKMELMDAQNRHEVALESARMESQPEPIASGALSGVY